MGSGNSTREQILKGNRKDQVISHKRIDMHPGMIIIKVIGTKRFRAGISALLWKKVILTRVLSVAL